MRTPKGSGPVQLARCKISNHAHQGSYFMAENSVGVSNWLLMSSTSWPSLSVLATTAAHSESARKTPTWFECERIVCEVRPPIAATRCRRAAPGRPCRRTRSNQIVELQNIERKNGNRFSEMEMRQSKNLEHVAIAFNPELALQSASAMPKAKPSQAKPSQAKPSFELFAVSG
jgi:hypothetical protein